MTFSTLQQSEHREAFIKECRQKAWGAACHADWVSKGVDELLAQYQKLEEEDRTLEADIKEAEIAIDYPWIKGESYETELLTSTDGASIDYEIEDARMA